MQVHLNNVVPFGRIVKPECESEAEIFEIICFQGGYDVDRRKGFGPVRVCHSWGWKHKAFLIVLRLEWKARTRSSVGKVVKGGFNFRWTDFA